MNARRQVPIEDRFWPKVDKSGECWIWTAAMHYGGYGLFSIGRKLKKAHRVAYELTHGPIPEGMEIDHLCHVRACVNPCHLRLATRKQNMENLAGPTVLSTSGVLGVTWNKRHSRWQAQVKHNDHLYRAGTYKTLEEASAAVRAKRLELFTHNAADRRPS